MNTPRAIELVANGAIRVDPLISARAPLADGPQWFERLYAARAGPDEGSFATDVGPPSRGGLSDNGTRRQGEWGTNEIQVKLRVPLFPCVLVSTSRAARLAAPTMPMTNPFDLTGKTALVTGASRGLGQQFARALAGAGADVAITSRTLDSLDATAKGVEAIGRRVVRLELNVREEASIQNAVAEAIRQLGHIDILMNNAGCNIRKPAVDVTWEDWATIVDTNLRGIFSSPKRSPGT